jgi:hypothetical protein
MNLLFFKFIHVMKETPRFPAHLLNVNVTKEEEEELDVEEQLKRTEG